MNLKARRNMVSDKLKQLQPNQSVSILDQEIPNVSGDERTGQGQANS
jgi:hypothetical protein